MITELAVRGHVLHLVADRPESGGGIEMVGRLSDSCSGVTYGWMPQRGDMDWLAFATGVRLTHDYLRYATRFYDAAPRLRERSRERTPDLGVRLVSAASRFGSFGISCLRAALDLVEESIPVPSAYESFLSEVAPDVVLLTPLVDLGSPQLDLLKATRRLGLRTVLCVGSWDHLSSKALIRIRPDLVTVWNEVQKREAIEMHGLPDEMIAVTGAQCYDQWFDRQPIRDRVTFCTTVGLPAERPFLLYVCSSPFRGEPPEANYVCRWIQAIRASTHERLRTAGILVRPHPSRLHEWEGRNLSALGPVVLFGRNPIDDKARQDYFESLWYSAAVVGLNTSAFLEAGIVGKSIHAVCPEEHAASQTGTLHFHYLLDVGGGLVRAARTLDEHVQHVSRILDAPVPSNVNRGFLETFIRPGGLDVAATPRFADAIEALASQVASPTCVSSWRGRMLAPLVGLAAGVRSSR